MGADFIDINLMIALQVIVLGFVGGVLSGFIGSGGAFFMTPGMMNLGVEGVVAVASNITHKFGKAMVGSHKHGEAGHVDKRLGASLLVTAIIGIQLAVWVNSALFRGASSHGPSKGAGANLYISLVFVIILVFVSAAMLRDALRAKSNDGAGSGPSRRLVEFFSRLKMPPMIHFKTADVTVSLWVLMVVGIATGYLAGTIGVGGFIGVPAMIYIIGVPTAVAAGTELYLAMFMGAYGALSYAYQGFVDIRMTVLLFLGSLLGIYLGVYGVKVVNEMYIRIVTGVIIVLCVISRAIAIPMYMRQLGFLEFDKAWDYRCNLASKIFLFASGITGVLVILYHVIRAYRQRRKIKKTLQVLPKPQTSSRGAS